jgi:hypothetical protein
VGGAEGGAAGAGVRVTPRPRVEDGAPYVKWFAIAAAMGCHERTARRWAKHPNPKKRLKTATDPFGRVYAERAWVAAWVKANTRFNTAA